MNTPKRVSFGSKGSMVETWIIYDEKDNQSLTQTDHAETQFQRNILLNTGIRPKNISFNIDNDATAQNGESPCDETDALDSTAPSAPSQPGESPKFQNGLESRDNPFVPGGELAIDTDDILKRATIVRDKFILDEQEKQKSENEKSALVQDKTDGPSDKDVGKSPDTKGPGKDLPKENGKVEEEKAEEQATRPPSGGQTGDLQDAPKEKKKQKKKCCTIM